MPRAQNNPFKDLYAKSLAIPGRDPLLPPIFLYKGAHPKHPKPQQRQGRTYVVVVDYTDLDATNKVFQYGFRRPISRRGQSNRARHPGARHTFLHDNGDLIMEVEDFMFLRHHDSPGAHRDVCITFGFRISELGDAQLDERTVALQARIIGPPADASPTAPQTITSEDGFTRIGGTALERDPRSRPIANTARAIPISISVEEQKGGLHAPTAGNRFREVPGGLEAQDEGFLLRREYMALTTEVGSRGLAVFGPPDLAAIYNERTDLVNAPRIGSAGNVGFTNQQSNQAGPQCRSAFDEEELNVTSIEEIGVFGQIHLDKRDLSAGLSVVIPLSRTLEEPDFHPGLMILTGLGVARRLDPTACMYFCGLHSHAGTVPTFDAKSEHLVRPDHVRILNVLYMSRYVLGAQGPSALASFAPNVEFNVSPEFRDPNIGPGSPPTVGNHNTYARDGISVMPAGSLGQHVARELLLTSIGVLLQMPQFMQFGLDRERFLSSFWFTDEQGERFQIGDWELGPGHAANGEDHPSPPDADPTLPRPHYNNHARAQAIRRWADHEELHHSSLPVIALAASTATDQSFHETSLYGSMMKNAKNGVALFTEDDSRKRKADNPAPGEAPAQKRPRGAKTKTAIATFLDHTHVLAAQSLTAALEAAPPMEAGASVTPPSHPALPSGLIPLPNDAENPDDDGEPEIDPDNRPTSQDVVRQNAAADKLLATFDLAALDSKLGEVTVAVDAALRVKTATPDVASHVEKLISALDLLKDEPFGEGAPQAVAKALLASTHLRTNLGLQSILIAIQRQRVMLTLSTIYQWHDRFVVPHLYTYANDIALEANHQSPSHPSPSMPWLKDLVKHVYDNIDDRTKPAPGALRIAAESYVAGLGTRSASIKQTRTTGDTKVFKTVEATAEVLRTWMGFSSGVKSCHERFSAVFVTNLYSSLGHGALLLEPVWAAFSNPDKLIAACRSGKQKLLLHDLEPFQRKLDEHPATEEGTAEREALDAIDEEYRRILKHTKIPPPPPLPPKPRPQPDNMLHFLRLALTLVPEAGGPARLPPDLSSGSDLKQALLRHMFENTDHRLPIRRSASGYQPLLSPSGPLHPSHLRSVAGLFSMGTFRGTTYHSPFALEHTLFDGPEEFLSAVHGRPTHEFVLDDCYGGRAQITRSRQYAKHAGTLWQTVNNPAVNYWLLGQTPPTPAPKKTKKAKAAPRARAQKPAAPPKPTYEEVLSVFLNKSYNFPMCGPLGAHLLASDYADAGVCSPPDAKTMARVICKIDAGAVAGLQALDYFHTPSTLDYVKQRSFVDLYEYLDGQLTDDEKLRLGWGPICLEHALCKYSRFIRHPTFYQYFEPS